MECRCIHVDCWNKFNGLHVTEIKQDTRRKKNLSDWKLHFTKIHRMRKKSPKLYPDAWVDLFMYLFHGFIGSLTLNKMSLGNIQNAGGGGRSKNS